MATLKVTNIKNESFAGDQLYLKSDGRLGIGTTSPTGDLEILGSLGLIIGNASGSGKLFADGGSTKVGSKTNHRLDLITNDTHRVSIDTSGNVGIGTTSPSRKLQLVGSNAMILIEGSGGNGRQYSLASSDDTTGAAVDGGNPGTFAIYDDTANASRLVINSSGNVGIGTTSPTNKLEISGGLVRCLGIASARFTVNNGAAEGFFGWNSGTLYLGGASALLNIAASGSNNIQLETNSSTRMTIKSDGDIEVGGNLKTNNLAGNNLLINGAMTINQKNTSSTSDGYQVSDMWWWGKFGMDQAVTTQSNVTNDHPDGFDHVFKLTVGTAESSLDTNEWATLRTRIEGQNLQHLKTGTASAEQITLSFWAKTGSANNGDQYSVTIIEGDFSGNDLIQKRSFTATSSWQRFTMTYVGQTSNVIRNDNDYGMTIYFVLVAASNKLDAADSTWETNTASKIAVTGQSNFFDNTSNEFYLTGVQLEVGSIATEFDHKLYGDELRRCQRYYKKLGGKGVNGQPLVSLACQSSSLMRSGYEFIPEMRAAPSISSADIIGITNGNGSAGSPTLTLSPVSNQVGRINATGMSGLVQGNAGWIQSSQSTGYIDFSAEL